jgi:hypothetical protein
MQADSSSPSQCVNEQGFLRHGLLEGQSLEACKWASGLTDFEQSPADEQHTPVEHAVGFPWSTLAPKGGDQTLVVPSEAQPISTARGHVPGALGGMPLNTTIPSTWGGPVSTLVATDADDTAAAISIGCTALAAKGAQGIGGMHSCADALPIAQGPETAGACASEGVKDLQVTMKVGQSCLHGSVSTVTQTLGLREAEGLQASLQSMGLGDGTRTMCGQCKEPCSGQETFSFAGWLTPAVEPSAYAESWTLVGSNSQRPRKRHASCSEQDTSTAMPKNGQAEDQARVPASVVVSDDLTVPCLSVQHSRSCPQAAQDCIHGPPVSAVNGDSESSNTVVSFDIVSRVESPSLHFFCDPGSNIQCPRQEQENSFARRSIEAQESKNAECASQKSAAVASRAPTMGHASSRQSQDRVIVQSPFGSSLGFLGAANTAALEAKLLTKDVVPRTDGHDRTLCMLLAPSSFDCISATAARRDKIAWNSVSGMGAEHHDSMRHVAYTAGGQGHTTAEVTADLRTRQGKVKGRQSRAHVQ